jgi:hypothetical protein
MEFLPYVGIANFGKGEPTEHLWVVENIIAEATKTILLGFPDSGKSWLAWDMALAVATGTPWLGFPTTRGRVLYMDEDTPGQVEVKRRITRLLMGRGLSPTSPLDVAITHQIGFSLTDHDKMHLLNNTLGVLSPKLVIMDSLVKVLGVEEENDAIAMAGALTALNPLIKEHCCAFLLIDHRRKGSSGTQVEWARGSGAKVAEVDRMLAIDDHTISIAKSRIAVPMDPFGFDIKDVDADSTRIELSGVGGRTNAQAVVLDAIKAKGMLTKDGLLRATSYGASAIEKAVAELQRDSKILGQGNPRTYSLPET